MSFFENIVSTVLLQSGCFELDQAFGESTQPTLMSQNLPNIERQLKRASFACHLPLPLLRLLLPTCDRMLLLTHPVSPSPEARVGKVYSHGQIKFSANIYSEKMLKNQPEDALS